MHKVLYVEDSIISQKIIQRMLSPIVDIELASTIAQAETRIFKGGIDLLLADYTLKEGTIQNLIAHVRHNWTPYDLPIIVITSTLGNRFKQTLLRAGVNAAYAKPINMAILREAVTDMIKNPSIAHPDSINNIDVKCVHWIENGKHIGFSPATNTQIEKPNEMELIEAMLQYLGQNFDHLKIIEPNIVTYNVKRNPEQTN